MQVICQAHCASEACWSVLAWYNTDGASPAGLRPPSEMANHPSAFLFNCHALVCSNFQALMTKDSQLLSLLCLLFLTSQLKNSCCQPYFYCPGRYHNLSQENSFAWHTLHLHRSRVGQQVCIRMAKQDRQACFVASGERKIQHWFLVYISCKFICLMKKKSSCQIFVGIFNTKELMSPLCHLLCSAQRVESQLTRYTDH